MGLRIIDICVGDEIAVRNSQLNKSASVREALFFKGSVLHRHVKLRQMDLLLTFFLFRFLIFFFAIFQQRLVDQFTKKPTFFSRKLKAWAPIKNRTPKCSDFYDSPDKHRHKNNVRFLFAGTIVGRPFRPVLLGLEGAFGCDN